MNVIVLDDEAIILEMESSMIGNLLPGADVHGFSDIESTLEFSKSNKVDIAFLDINLEAGNGIELARKLQYHNPKINIIFCTGYSEYSLEALELYCSAYLMKPLREEQLVNALKKLRYPVSEKVPDLYVQCFGNFEVTYKGRPLKFKYGKTRELMACLIDRRGAVLNIREIMAVIFDDDTKESYVRNIKADLIDTFRLYGIESTLIHGRGKIGVNRDRIDCDYYDYLNGNKDLFKGEYMSQYSFAERTLANLSAVLA